MSDEEFNKQYDAAQIRGEFALAVSKFVVDSETALAALQELHERTQALTSDHDAKKPLYYLNEDICDLLENAYEYYQTAAIATNDLEFKDDDEILARTETI
jgi:hypothetical protein